MQLHFPQRCIFLGSP